MDKPIPITPAQLLLVDPNAYINLVLMFPLPEGTKSLDDVPAFELDRKKFQLLLVAPHEAVLLSKDPPGIFAYDKEAYAWKPVPMEVQRQPRKG